MEICSSNIDEVVNEIVEISQLSFPNPYSEDKIRERLAGKKSWVYTAQEESKIVGFKIWYEEDQQIYSWLGAVHPDYRRRGIATRLMEEQFKLSRENGYRKITLKTHHGNPEMVKMCQKEGFQQTKTDPNHFGPGLDAIYFEYLL